jgi:hypothetical protein
MLGSLGWARATGGGRYLYVKPRKIWWFESLCGIGGSSRVFHRLPIPHIFCHNPHMRHLTAILSLTLTVLLGSAGVSWSVRLQKGLTAAQSGYFANSLREFRPLAEQGNADAQFYMV